MKLSFFKKLALNIIKKYAEDIIKKMTPDIRDELRNKINILERKASKTDNKYDDMLFLFIRLILGMD